MISVPPPLPVDYKLFPGIGYYKFHVKPASNFDDAVSICFKEGGYLAIINSKEESDVLKSLLNKNPETKFYPYPFSYLGFHDRYKEGEFVTIFVGEPSFLGTLDCVQLVNDFLCNCRPGYMGRRCESRVDFCERSPCQNGGVCGPPDVRHYPRQGSRRHQFPLPTHSCICPEGYHGRNCEFHGRGCESAPCRSGGTCLPDAVGSSGRGYVCMCPPGTTGSLCEIDSVDECNPNPCRQDGVCQDRPGGHVCLCPPKWAGKDCEIYDPTFRGGVGWPLKKREENVRRTTTAAPAPRFDFDAALERERQKCIEKGCRERAGDMRCDEECNKFACDFDGADCSLGRNPWRNCTAPINCWEVFMNGICDPQCNNPGCLYDGRDCENVLHPCNPNYDAYCQQHFANGHCDYGCNNAECNWDGLDCEATKLPDLAEGAISVVVLMDTGSFLNNRVPFLREVGHALRTNLRVKKDDEGRDMVYPWTYKQSDPRPAYPPGSRGVMVYLEIDNRRCIVEENASCFTSAKEAADYLAATAATHTLSTTFPIVQVRGEFGPGDDIPEGGGDIRTNTKYVVIGFVVVIVLGLLAGVLAKAQRKRAHGVTWFPEGFLRNNSVNNNCSSGQRRRSRRRGPDGQEMRNLNKQPSCMDVGIDGMGVVGGMGHLSGPQPHLHHHIHPGIPPPPIHGTTPDGPMTHWSDEGEEEDEDGDSDHLHLAPPKRPRAAEAHGPGAAGYASDHTVVTEYEDSEPRMGWGIGGDHMGDTGAVLTPPSLEASHQDLENRVPPGMTPLMVAAIRGGVGLDTGEEGEEGDGSSGGGEAAAAIAELVAQGAELNATMEKTGETSLHLAARYARADAAKRLLDAGADANAQDHTGRTPLHAAVASDAMGVFQILLRNRATNLNARMLDGTTPLVLAARLAIEGMVEDLINADADINAADNGGKTALHWAAAVNNVDAVNTLLAHGANRDAQDDKDETPLFLAAREGSYEACRALLDHHANREITDHMDRLPRDVAQERLHHDMVRLLDEHVPRPPAHHHHHHTHSQPHTAAGNGSILPATSVAGPTGTPSRPTVVGGRIGGAGGGSKSKKRPKANASPSSPGEGDAGIPGGAAAPSGAVVRRKPSTKKKRPTVTEAQRTAEAAAASLSSGSPSSSGASPAHSLESPPSLCSPRTVGSLPDATAATPGPFDGAAGAYAVAAATVGNGIGGTVVPGMTIPAKQPPSYEDCMKAIAGANAAQEGQYYGVGPYQAVGGAPPPPPPPLQQQQHLRVTSPSGGQVGGFLPSPPPAQQVPRQPSPAKARPAGNVALLRTATHQQAMASMAAGSSVGPFGDFPPEATTMQHQQQPQQPYGLQAQQQSQQQPQTTVLQSQQLGATNVGLPGNPRQHHQYYPHYLTPPSQHSQGEGGNGLAGSPGTPTHPAQYSHHSLLHPPENFPTPSPESPGHWSSSSPRSNSDWSEGVSSPVYASHPPPQATLQKQQEAIYL
ncbi:hypothetical protein J437_LFUL018752 [Ladona fulva]|uniref:Notch n=1 Tax=Ladona fulva TaxID=123851 RepID=A0A8K0KJ33_LADFU|nr:hypothetical protein J437_LFUL018752 [Ladona fulva]